MYAHYCSTVPTVPHKNRYDPLIYTVTQARICSGVCLSSSWKLHSIVLWRLVNVSCGRKLKLALTFLELRDWKLYCVGFSWVTTVYKNVCIHKEKLYKIWHHRTQTFIPFRLLKQPKNHSIHNTHAAQKWTPIANSTNTTLRLTLQI